MQSSTSHPYAQRLAQDLFDALWLEDLYGFRKHCRFHSVGDGDTMLEVALDEGAIAGDAHRNDSLLNLFRGQA